MKAEYDDLVYRCPYLPDFSTSAEIEPAQGFIGQERAKKAVETALKINEKGFNVFVVGLPGTGRRSFVTSFLQKYSLKMPAPKDWVYVYNFSNPSEPRAISLESGKGSQLKSDMEKLSEEVIELVEKTFESEDYASKRSELEDEYMRKKTVLWQELQEKAKELGFAVQITSTGVVTVPIYDGKPLTPETLDSLPDNVKEMFNENSRKLKHIIDGTLYKSRKLDREYKEKLKDLDKYAALFTIGALFDEIKKQYESNYDVVEYLSTVENDVLANLSDLRSENEDLRQLYKKRYSVNLIVDNSELQGAPVIFERNPTYSNLAGKVEYYSKGGIMLTDFTLIKAGAFHRANGGFLILEVENLLKNPYAWECVKRALLSEEITIENLENALGFSNVVSLRPQPIPLNVKVFLIASPKVYYLMHAYDEDVRKLFRVKSEFDWELEMNEDNVKKYLGFISSTCCEFKLPHLNREAVEKILWYSSKLAADRGKLSVKLGEISSLIREACSIAEERENKTITRQDVVCAIEQREERVSLIQEKYDSQIKARDLMIETSGNKIGQVNGLTVMELSDHSFGVPVKITARAHLGKSGVVDIQREADLSGKIHSKAVLTIEGFFGERYAGHVPLSISATINFEQVYGMIEGDSASLAEVIALISAIAKIPVKQEIAVTGSMNQHGEVQPVGGVTEKVEGFHRACKLHGMTGSQGVVIPKSNLKNLVLSDGVLSDIKQGRFHIWTVEHVDDAIELLTGKKAGKLTKTGGYERGSVNYLVIKALQKAREISENRVKTLKRRKTRKSK